MKIYNERTKSPKSINLDIAGNLTEYSLKSILVNSMFILTIFQILLLKRAWYYDLQSRLKGTKVLDFQ